MRDERLVMWSGPKDLGKDCFRLLAGPIEADRYLCEGDGLIVTDGREAGTPPHNDTSPECIAFMNSLVTGLGFKLITAGLEGFNESLIHPYEKLIFEFEERGLKVIGKESLTQISGDSYMRVLGNCGYPAVVCVEPELDASKLLEDHVYSVLGTGFFNMDKLKDSVSNPQVHMVIIARDLDYLIPMEVTVKSRALLDTVVRRIKAYDNLFRVVGDGESARREPDGKWSRIFRLDVGGDGFDVVG